jgi:hypothetical protein
MFVCLAEARGHYRRASTKCGNHSVCRGSTAASRAKVRCGQTNKGVHCEIGHCQVGQKFADQLKVADYHSAAFGPQKRAFDQSTQPGHFRQTDPILPQLDNATQSHSPTGVPLASSSSDRSIVLRLVLRVRIF